MVNRKLKWSSVGVVFLVSSYWIGAHGAPQGWRAELPQAAAPLGEIALAAMQAGHDLRVTASHVYDGSEIRKGVTVVTVSVDPELHEKDAEFTAYIESTGGPIQGTPPTTKTKKTDWGILHSDPGLNLVNGWAYLSGAYPVVTTDRLTAGGSGTRIVVEIDTTAADVHRVYLLNYEPAPAAFKDTVKVSTSRSTRILDKADTYLEVQADGTIIPPAPDLSDPRGYNIAGSSQAGFIALVKSKIAGVVP